MIFFFAFFRAAPLAYGGFQARGLIRAVAASLHQSHSNAGSEPSLLFQVDRMASSAELDMTLPGILLLNRMGSLHIILCLRRVIRNQRLHEDSTFSLTLHTSQYISTV